MAWEQLAEYLNNHQVNLGALSPRVTARELYRFTVEELFEHEMDDTDLPGFTSDFIYDEFYPDYEFENTNIAVDDCIREILSVKPLEWMVNYKKENLQLNEHKLLTEDGFKAKVNQFKNAYDEINTTQLSVVKCTLEEELCRVTGNFGFTTILQTETIPLSGDWLVEFEWDQEFGYWDINNVQIEGIKF